MPRLLKNDTVRLIEASIETLGLAQIGICTFRRDILKVEQVRYSAEIGLIGSSLELIMSAILIQAIGKKSVYKDYDSGRYKTASEILADFRTLLKQSSSNTLFLTTGINNPDIHMSKLVQLTNRFHLIITSRANGLHNGYGLKYELVASLFQNVTEFIQLLSLSNNIKPYLTKVPELVGIQIDKKILIDDIYNQLQNSKNTQEQKSLISSLFLILPEVPKQMPEWVTKFDSLKIAPKKTDIVYLIDALEQANPVSLNKVTDTTNQLNVTVVGRNVDGAIPITAHFLKTSFTQKKDQFYADIATANGRLNSQQLDLPPKSSIYNAFAYDVEQLGILENGGMFTAHQSWPFIVEAIKVAKTNTTAPYWFLVRLTEDLGQLKSCLKKASKFSNNSLKTNISAVITGIEAIEQEKYIENDFSFIQQIVTETESFSNNLEKLEKFYQKYGLNGLTTDYENELNDIFSEETSLNILLSKIYHDDKIEASSKRYWVAKLAVLMPEKQDLPILLEILENKEFQNAHTNIRKTFRARDFADYGPKVKIL